MGKIDYDMIYLAGCGVNRVRPSEEFLRTLQLRVEQSETVELRAGKSIPYLEALYLVSKAHNVDALIGTTLKENGVTLPQKWIEAIHKAVRKALLFDVERKQILDFLEQKGIWYLPLKGVILKEYYPGVGTRQMSDNDILYDSAYCSVVKEYMLSRGYQAVNVNRGNHDVYHKEPVLSFELHQALYGASHDKLWQDYYENVKQRLIPDEGSAYGYHFRKEDFYVYIVCHAYKHYSVSGTGLRTLLDFYVFLAAEGESLDFDYISRETAKLGIDAFEALSRSLCRKIFAPEAKLYCTDRKVQLTDEEQGMLEYCLESGTYGKLDHYTENLARKKGKAGFVLYKFFLPLSVMRSAYPILKRAPFLLPFCWLYRMGEILFKRDRRSHALGVVRSFIKTLRR